MLCVGLVEFASALSVVALPRCCVLLLCSCVCDCCSAVVGFDYTSYLCGTS